MFDNIKCVYCGKYYSNSSGVVIQINKQTNKMQCENCAIKEYEETKQLTLNS